MSGVYTSIGEQLTRNLAEPPKELEEPVPARGNKSVAQFPVGRLLVCWASTQGALWERPNRSEPATCRYFFGGGISRFGEWEAIEEPGKKWASGCVSPKWHMAMGQHPERNPRRTSESPLKWMNMGGAPKTPRWYSIGFDTPGPMQRSQLPPTPSRLVDVEPGAGLTRTPFWASLEPIQKGGGDPSCSSPQATNQKDMVGNSSISGLPDS